MTLWHDVRFAIRGMIKARGITIVALLTLAIGIGATTAIFSIVNGVLLRPLPFHDPGQLVTVRASLPGLGAQNAGFSVPEFEDLRDRAGIFQAVSVVWPAPANLTGGEKPERIDILGVSPNYFDVLGVRPQLGRLFDKRDVAEGFAEAAVISDGLWRREFGSDPAIIGRKVRVDNDLYTIVGVLPADFRHPAAATTRPIDLWGTAGFRAAPFAPPKRNIRQLPAIMGRLKPGITPEQASARLATMAASLRREYASDYPANGNWTLDVTPLKGEVVGKSHTLLLTLLLAVAVILLIACVNVASLLLAKASARRREIAVRMALGASRRRIVRQLLTESVVLGLAAASVGVLTAVLTQNALITLLPRQMPRVDAIAIDSRVLLFSLGLALLTSILFGLAPALQTSRVDANALKQDGRSGDNTLRSGRIRSLLVGAEVALSVVLVIGAGLLLRTFWDLLHVDPGFSSENVLAANVWLPVPNDPKTDVYGTNEQRAAFSREVLRRLRGVSGVEYAAISSALPLRTPIGPTGFRVEGISEQGDAPAAVAVLISPDFFTVMRTSLIRGTMFSDGDDPKAPPVVLVDQAAARYFWHGQDPIGRRIRLSRDIFVNGKLQAPPWMTVIGVVDDIKFSKLDEKSVPHLYANLYQISGKIFNIVVRGKGDTATLGRNIQAEIQSVDPNLPVSDVTSLTEVVSASVADRRFAASLIGAFALLALVLAGVGVYGVATYSVQQRMREFGIRSALGASTRDLVRMVLRDSMVPVLGGVVTGLLVAAISVRLITTLLFGVRPVDLPVYLIATFVLAMVGVLANYLPALRAGRVDPNIALRSE